MKKHTILVCTFIILLFSLITLTLSCGQGQTPKDDSPTYTPFTGITLTGLPPTNTSIIESASGTLMIVMVSIIAFLVIGYFLARFKHSHDSKNKVNKRIVTPFRINEQAKNQ